MVPVPEVYSASFPLIVAEVFEQVNVAVFAGTMVPAITVDGCAWAGAVSVAAAPAVTVVPRDAGTRAGEAAGAGRRFTRAMPCPPMPPGLFGYHHSWTRVVVVPVSAATS